MTFNSLPDFYLLGFQRCGTTTVHHCLKKINSISLPNNKETHFFSSDEKYSRGMQWYKEQFPLNTNSKIKGEIDPSYILKKSYLNRINKFSNNETRFIFIFRKPLERSYSHYLLSLYRGYEKESFLNSILEEERRLSNDNDNFSLLNHSYISRSKYSYYLDNFQSIFPDAKKLFLKFDNIKDKKNQYDLINQVITFLDIDIDISKINFSVQSNASKTYKSKILRDILYSENILKKTVNNIIGEDLSYKVKLFFDKMNQKKNTNINNSLDKINLPDKYYRWNNDETQ